MSGTWQLKVPPVTVAGTPLHVTLETPDRASETVPITVTGDAVKSAPFAGAVIAIAGAVLSRFTMTDAAAKLPAKSTPVPVTCWPAPSTPTTSGLVHEATRCPSLGSQS